MLNLPKQTKTWGDIKQKVVALGIYMPSEIFDYEKFVEISERAEYCAVKRLKDIVKLKPRTAKRLYALRVEPAKAEEIIKKLQCEIREA